MIICKWLTLVTPPRCWVQGKVCTSTKPETRKRNSDPLMRWESNKFWVPLRNANQINSVFLWHYPFSLLFLGQAFKVKLNKETASPFRDFVLLQNVFRTKCQPDGIALFQKCLKLFCCTVYYSYIIYDNSPSINITHHLHFTLMEIAFLSVCMLVAQSVFYMAEKES